MTANQQNDSDAVTDAGSVGRRERLITPASAICQLLDRLKTFVQDNRDLIDAAFGRVVAANDRSGPRPLIEPPPQPSGATATESEEPTAAAIVTPPLELLEPKLTVPAAALEPPPSRATPAPDQPRVDTSDLIAQLRISNGISSRRGPGTLVPPSQPRETPYLEEFSKIRRLARTHERAVRALRRLRRDPANPRAQRCLQDRIAEANRDRLDCWFGDQTLVKQLPTDDLAGLQLRYQSLSDATGWFNELLTTSPSCVTRGASHTDRAKLHERLQAVATAQCGLRTEVDRIWAERAALPCCMLQDLTFRRVTATIARDALAVFLEHMTRDSTVSLAGTKRLIAAIESARMIEDRVDLALAMEQAIAVEESSEGEGAIDDDDDVETVASAFALARSDLGPMAGAIVLTERAADSARDSTFRRPAIVRRALVALGEAAAQWHAAPNGTLNCAFRQLLVERGFHEKRAAEGTMQRYHDDYFMNFEGREVPIGLHITLGSRNANTCLSIHWWRDEAIRRVVVGHCGRHLPNQLT